jgi:hypothetical protein
MVLVEGTAFALALAIVLTLASALKNKAKLSREG